MAADMICAYYGEGAESRALFGKCKISQIEREENELPWDVYLEKFDVIRLVMTDFFKKGLSINEGLIRLQKLVVRDLVKSYPDTDFLTQMICFNQ